MNVIQGSYYINTDLTVVLDTTVILTGNSSLNLLVLFPDGTIKSYAGTVSNYTKCQATIPADDNNQSGALMLQVHVTLSSAALESETCQLNVLQSFAPT